MKHGGDLTGAMAHHGGGFADWLDLSTGINPHAYPLPDMAEEAWTSLPTQAAHQALLDAARSAYAVPAGAGIAAAPGTQSLIQWLPFLLGQGPVAIVSPTYSEHALAWKRYGAEVIESSLRDPYSEAARHLVIVNPNNPDGHIFSLEALETLARQAQRRGGMVILDESFIDVMPGASAAVLCGEMPVVVMRSFGKFYGLAGVRLGFLIAAPAITGRVSAALGPWAVAGPALSLGRAALADRDWARRMRLQLTDEAAVLDGVLEGQGFALAGGTALYRLVSHPQACAIHNGLAARRIWTRRFDWDETLLRFGLPRDADARLRLEAALREVTVEIAHARAHGSITG
jgi:cobalamin biosynthesis protein CobC